MSESPNPFQPAVSADAEPARRKPYTITAVSRPWVILAALLAVARFFFLPLFARFDTGVPTLTMALMWIYTPLFFFAAGVAFLAIAGLFKGEKARRRVGLASLIVACTVGVLALGLGYGLPCLALWVNLRAGA